MATLRVGLILAFLALTATDALSRSNKLIKNHGSGRVVGGTEAAEAEIPWQVAIETYDGIHYCGSSIVTERHFISAGHCYDFPPTYWRVIAGSLTIAEPDSYHNVTKITRHEDFNNYDLINDISIWEVDPPFVWSDKVSPIALPPPDMETPDGLVLTTSGWGKTYDDPYPEMLMKVDVPVVSPEYCADVWWDVNDIYPSQICAGAPGKDSCNGDSGGPLFRDGVLYGIVSWGAPLCGDVELPGVYTRVSSHRDWIFQQIGI